MFFNKEQENFFEELILPYSLEEIENEYDEDSLFMMIVADSNYLNKLSRKTQKPEIIESKRLFDTFFLKNNS